MPLHFYPIFFFGLHLASLITSITKNTAAHYGACVGGCSFAVDDGVDIPRQTLVFVRVVDETDGFPSARKEMEHNTSTGGDGAGSSKIQVL